MSQTWSSHLSVYPVSGNIPIDSEDCFGFFQMYVPQDLQASGVSDADMAIYVGAETSIVEGGQEINLCEAGTLAFAFSCSIDQFDRPVIGAINFCISNIGRRLQEVDGDVRKLGIPTWGKESLSSSLILERNDPLADLALLSIHEVGHALGFALNLMKYYRDSETGEPLTPRPFSLTDVTCVDGTVQSLFFPATNTIATRQDSDGRIYHEIVTPRVTQVARNQFNCQTMTGARLENQPTGGGDSCTGSHWDERLYLSELMGPVFSGYTDILSPLTVALFEDTGWYRVTYENAMLSPYGKGRGCDFVNEPCIVDDQVPAYGRNTFCNTTSIFTNDGISSEEVVCDPTHKSFVACDLFDITTLPADVAATIPDNRIPRFSNPDLVSLFNRADFCPLPLIDVRLDCTNDIGNSDLQTYQGESRGVNSRCINGRIGSVRAPGCFAIECDESLHKVIINGQTCDFEGQQLSVPTLDFRSASVECPDIAIICPDLFCPGECSGRGICNYDVVPPRCECFDTEDTTAACSKDLPPPSGPPSSSSSKPTSGSPVEGRTVWLALLVPVVIVVCSILA